MEITNVFEEKAVNHRRLCLGVSVSTFVLKTEAFPILMRLRACVTSAGPFGLWSMAELTVGVITGCLPVMPRFFKHVGSKVLYTFSPPSEPSSSSGHDLRSKIFKSTPLAKIKPAFVRHSAGLTTSDSDIYPYARHPGEYYPLSEVEAPQHQADRDPFPQSGIGVATRRNDLEYEHGEVKVVNDRLASQGKS